MVRIVTITINSTGCFIVINSMNLNLFINANSIAIILVFIIIVIVLSPFLIFFSSTKKKVY